MRWPIIFLMHLFLSCLAAYGAENLFELRSVHPDNDALVAENRFAPGYRRYEYRFTGSKGIVFTEILYLKNTPIITQDDIAFARSDSNRPGSVYVTLKPAGADTMHKTTAAMKRGRDRIAIIIEGKIVCAPIVCDILFRNFAISGLETVKKADELSDKIMKHVSKLQKCDQDAPKPNPA